MAPAPTRFALVLFALLLPTAWSAAASDGVLEINQARALAGSVTPGDAPGFPVEIYTRGNFRLTSDLVVPPDAPAAIAVYAAGTHIDLGGFSISGPTQCSGTPLTCAPAGTGIGIDASGASEVVVENGRIAGFGLYGAWLFEGGRAEHLGVESNAGTGVVADRNCVLADDIVRRNGGAGIQVGAGSRVATNVVSGNKLVGADLDRTAGFAQNTFEANAGGSVHGGRATGGNVCDDGLCSARGTRRFYLTPQTVPGSQALGACASGFHMASAWEIFDVSTLEYATPLGATNADAGSGPPTEAQGWIRTGLYSNSGSASAFSPNCKVWISSPSPNFGSAIQIPGSWGDTTFQRVHPWQFTTFSCDTTLRVWCVED